MPIKNAPVVSAMQTLSGQYPRFGARRIRVFLEREGIQIGKERCTRLWAQAGLQVPKKRRRRRIAGSRLRPFVPAARNSVWSYDFVFDSCANGQQLKCLTVVDEFTRECLAIDVAGSIRSRRVIEVLSRLVSQQGVNGGAKGNHKAVGKAASPEAYPAIQEWIEEGRKDVHRRGPLRQSKARRDGGRRQSARGSKALWDCPQDGIEDARTLGAAGL
jgi:transposase InsO family protein